MPTMWPYDYGEPFPFDKIEEGSKVLMVDITTNPYSTMFRVNAQYDLFVIDHHKSFIESDAGKNINGLLTDGVAACQLTWHHFFLNDPTPEIIRLLGEYDVWKNEDKDQWENSIMPTQMAMRMKHTDPATNVGHTFWDEYISSALKGTHHSKEIEMGCWGDGNTIIAYQKMEDKKAVDFYSFEAEFEGLRAICLNNTRFNSQVYESVWDPEKYDIMVAWVNVRGDSYTFSMYTEKEDIDVSKIARKFGGGGHKKAAGFQCDNFLIARKEAGQKVIEIEKAGDVRNVKD